MKPSDKKLLSLRQDFEAMLKEPVDEKVFLAAASDAEYAEKIFRHIHEKEIVMDLLRNPPEIKKEHTNTKLLFKAGEALVNWAKTGFHYVHFTVLEKRENACLKCPHIGQPQKLLQKMISSSEVSDTIGQRVGNKICTVCGCSLKKKLKLLSETCPQASDDDPAINLWEEAIDNV